MLEVVRKIFGFHESSQMLERLRMYRLSALEGVVHGSANAINDESIDNIGSSLLILQRMTCASGGDSGDKGLNRIEASFYFSFGGQAFEVALWWPHLPLIAMSNTEKGLTRMTRRTHKA